jgi:hypothetical protein
LKDFCLKTPMEPKDCAHMRIPASVIPDAIMPECDLAKLVHNKHVCVEIRKGMHGLPQAGRLASDRLINFLAPHGCTPVPITSGLWTHSTRPLVFTLVVDDFGTKHIDKADADHLLETSRLLCKASVDWDAKQHCGLTLVFDCINCTCDIRTGPPTISASDPATPPTCPTCMGQAALWCQDTTCPTRRCVASPGCR